LASSNKAIKRRVDLPAAVLDFESELLGHFRVAGWFGSFKQASYLWQR